MIVSLRESVHRCQSTSKHKHLDDLYRKKAAEEDKSLLARHRHHLQAERYTCCGQCRWPSSRECSCCRHLLESVGLCPYLQLNKLLLFVLLLVFSPGWKRDKKKLAKPVNFKTKFATLCENMCTF